MTDADNLVLEQLRAAIDGLCEDIHEINLRLGHVEEGVARLHVQLAEHSVRFDRLGMRLDQIERRLDR